MLGRPAYPLARRAAGTARARRARRSGVLVRGDGRRVARGGRTCDRRDRGRAGRERRGGPRARAGGRRAGPCRPAPCCSGRTASASSTRQPSSTSASTASPRARSGSSRRAATLQSRSSLLAAEVGLGDVPLRVAREPGRPRGGRARRGARGARRDARDCRLPRGLSGRPRVRASRVGGGEAGASARWRRERCGRPGGAVPYGSPGQRLGSGGRGGQGGGDPPGRARRASSSTSPSSCSERARPRGRRVAIVSDGGGSAVIAADLAVGCGARASAALIRAFGAPGRGDAANGVDDESRRLRRRRRAGPALLRARATPAARVGRGRLGLPDRLPRRLQRDLGRAARARDGGGARARPGRGRCGPPGDRPDDVLAGGSRAGIARVRRRGLSRGRFGGLVAREGRRAAGRRGGPGAAGPPRLRSPMRATSQHGTCSPRQASCSRRPDG